MTVVVDGVSCPEHDGIRRPAFSPDSRRMAYAGRRGNNCRIVVDPHETERQYDAFSAGGELGWDEHEAFHTLAVGAGEIVGVQVELLPNDEN
jgi:hypothetical protein